MSRARLALLALLLALPLARPTAAQQAATNQELEAERDAAHEAWSRAIAQRDRVRDELAGLHRERVRQTQVVRRLETQQVGFFEQIPHRWKVEAAKNQLKAIGDRIELAEGRLYRAEQRERVRRLTLIQKSWDWVARLLQRVDRATMPGRDRQARELADQAMKELAFIEDLESMTLEAAPPPPLPDLEEEAQKPVRELEALVDFYRESATTFEGEAEKLRPYQERMQQRLAHLDRLAERGFAVPTLAERRVWVASRLSQVQALIRSFEGAAERCRERVQALEAALGNGSLVAPPPRTG